MRVCAYAKTARIIRRRPGRVKAPSMLALRLSASAGRRRGADLARRLADFLWGLSGLVTGILHTV